MSASRPDILNKILARKHQEIEARQQQQPVASLRQQAEQASTPRGFVAALQARVARGESAVIAEIKKASPSKGSAKTSMPSKSPGPTRQVARVACRCSPTGIFSRAMRTSW
jgi:indole-3-glycerol phosphate synthase